METTTETTTAITHAVSIAPTLAWDAPTTYTDGSSPVDLVEYRVYFSTSSDSYSAESYYPVSAPTTSVKVKDVIPQAAGMYFFVVTAVDKNGAESVFSNKVSIYLY